MWAGHWTTVEIFEPSDEMPKGKEDKGAETMHPGPGGLSLIGDYESHGAPFGHMVVTWIPKEKVYKSYWTDLSQPGVSVSTGKWEGDKLVFTSVDESTGTKLAIRDTYSDITPTSFTDTLETGPLGGPMKKVLTVKYTKQVDVADSTACGSDTTSQFDMNQCTANQYRKADAKLNIVYGKLMKSFQDATSGQNLRDIEKIWIQYRDLHCKDARSQYEGGSIAPAIWATCMTTTTNHRVEEIRAAYESEGLSLE